MIMNKKVSTIFAMAALMGGSLFSSAYATDLVDFVDLENDVEKVDLSKQYFIEIGGKYLRAVVDADTKAISYTFVDAVTTDIDQNDVKEFLWTLSASKQANGNMGYEIKNAESGELIRIDVTNSQIVTTANSDETAYKNASTVFYFGNDGQDPQTPTIITDGYNPGKIYVAEQGLMLDNNATPDDFDVTNVDAKASTITLKAIAPGIDVEVSDLNKLYNSAGFNFALTNDKLADVTNIFGDKKVLALNVAGDVEVKINDVKYAFPKGTYFVTATPWTISEGTKFGVNPTKAESDYDFLTRCTFIAIDSDDNILDDADAQKVGRGFTLTEVSGKDLVTYKETLTEQKDGSLKWVADDDEMSKGNQIAAANACFKVQESTTSEGIYELTVEKARVVEASSADKQIEASLKLTAAAKTSEIYTTESTDPSFIFEFAESTVVKPIDLLHKGDTATIVNIRFYKANGTDNSYDEKYLTTDAAGAAYVAKGKVLADLDAPAYQWVISAVDANNNVTFQNRETGKTLKTQLFDEGNGIYSLAPDNGNAYFQYYLLTEEGIVTVADKDGNLSVATDPKTEIKFQGIKVELIESKATNYAGYVNVEDETLMTLSFGRDIAPTSNKLYPYVTEDGGYSIKPGAALTSEVGDAAQWLLIRHKDARVEKYNYVYANGSLVNTKNNGDVVYAAKYAFQLVLDGKVVKTNSGTPYYLNADGDDVIATTDPTYFSISENADGSVNVMKDRAATEALLIDDYDDNTAGTEGVSINAYKDKNFSLKSIDNLDSKATDVKTFLIAEAPAISLPANEGHYSFVSETGNYITKDENRDAFAAREESEAMYLYVTDKDEVVPSFYVTLGKAEAEGERMFLFCPEDSVDYYVATGSYDKKYQWAEEETKAIFKAAAINETRDTLTTSIKGEATLVASEANNTEKVEGGIERFKMQIVEAQDADGMYVVRQVGGDWLKSINGKLAWGSKTSAIKFEITPAEAPTANEGVSATEVKVIATDGAINIKNAAGKNVVISTILGQIVANEVLTSDNATISVPAGIAIVSVDGEEAVKVSVK
jgi:hypothetical protein